MKKNNKVTEKVIKEVEVLDTPTTQVIEPPKNTWEIKDRLYKLIQSPNSPWYRIRTVSAASSPLYYYDEEAQRSRPLRLSSNHATPFMDEQEGDVMVRSIEFNNGHLYVGAQDVDLQKFLSIYHPDNDKVWYEVKPNEEAQQEVASIDDEIDALIKAREISIDHAAAILRVEQGNRVDSKKSDELRRDILIYAKHNPLLFLDFVSDDDLMLKEVGIKAVNHAIIQLTDGNSIFKWANGKKLFTVPFDEQPYSALGRYFKTDEGVEVFKAINKKLAL